MSAQILPFARSSSGAWPAPLAAAAFHGPLGEAVAIIEPHTEADPVAILAQGLLAFGSALGRCAQYQVEATRHYTNEFAVLVGSSSRARKGSSWDQVADLFGRVDESWSTQCIASGLSSGEGLIWRVRDADEEEEKDDGVAVEEATQKRLLTLEPEFASVLKVSKRQENTLSANLRNAWDGKPLETMTKNTPARASRAHISIVGHITREELLRNVDVTEVANGFLNRFMLFAVRSSKTLPFGGDLDPRDLERTVERLRAAISFGRRTGRVAFAGAARDAWPSAYASLRDGHHGLLGAATARAEAHVVRLALLYALLDCSGTIERPHLDAALAVWRYSEASAAWIFGVSLGDPLADELWDALRPRPAGMSRTEIRDWFSRNKRKSDIDRALFLLRDAGLVACDRVARTAGAPEVETWRPLAAGDRS